MTTDTPTNDSVHAAIWKTISLLADSVLTKDTGPNQAELAVCFEELKSSDSDMRSAAEERIWALWCDYPSPEAKVVLADGIRFLSGGNLAQAEAIFDRLVCEYPTWAETWNKRATVYFLQNRDAQSVADIFRTLELEPRHFGALGGLAQICARNGAPDAVKQALLRLLEIYPHASGVAEAVAAFGDNVPPVLH